MISVLRRILVVACVGIVVETTSSQAAAEDVPIVDGTLWMQSSDVEKRSYVIGAGNFISIEYLYQSKAEQPPTYHQSSVPDFYKYTDGLTLDEIIEAADNWYKNHPDDMDTPVLTVFWDTLVEPKIK